MDVPECSGHPGLIAECAKWAIAHRYSVVAIAECHVKCTKEVPDLLGFKATGQATLFEIKMSRSDFKADGSKPFRKKEHTGMGLYRYYVTPYGLISPEELPEGWGLLWIAEGGRCYLKATSKRFLKRDQGAEAAILVSALRRVGAAAGPLGPCGVSCKAYKVATKGRTQLYLEGEQLPEE